LTQAIPKRLLPQNEQLWPANLHPHGIFQGAHMRLISLLLLVSVAFGCDSSMSKPGSDPRAAFGTTFPAITSLTPNTSPVNSVPFTMTIQGSNFNPDAVAFWNGNVQQTTFINSGQLQVTVTEADLMLAGVTHVFVRTGGMNTNTVDFTVTPQ